VCVCSSQSVQHGPNGSMIKQDKSIQENMVGQSSTKTVGYKDGWLWLASGGRRRDVVHSTLTCHNGTSTQLSTSSYRNSTRTHLLTHPSSGLEPGPDSDRTTPKIPAAQLHTSSHPPSTSQHSPFPHTSIHRRPQPLMGTHLQPCRAAPNLPAALASPPTPPIRRGGAAPSSCGLLLGPLWGLGALNVPSSMESWTKWFNDQARQVHPRKYGRTIKCNVQHDGNQSICCYFNLLQVCIQSCLDKFSWICAQFIHGRQPVREYRPGFGVHSIAQKLRAYNIIRVLNIIKLKLYNIIKL
jgi:hypothetical protein